MKNRRGEIVIGKKGLSPLIATILLIAFAVALGTLVMNWSIQSAPSSSSPCDDIALSLQQLPGGEAICYDAQIQSMRFLVKNTGLSEISTLRMRVIDSQQKLEEKELQADLTSGGIGKYEFPYATISPNQLSASIIPGILVNAEPQYCPTKELQVVGVPLC